jgi:hypothetical protein
VLSFFYEKIVAKARQKMGYLCAGLKKLSTKKITSVEVPMTFAEDQKGSNGNR